MPAIGFLYPNGDKVTFEDVRKGNVDIVKMGMSLPTLIEMSKERDPNRKPSTTELLVGTCESYLKRTKEYYVNPQDRAFSLAGTMHHAKLEQHEDDRHMLEEKLEEFDITGIADLYDKETKTLLDYKNTGSYKCAQLLGMTYRLVPDPSGARYKISGKWGKKGTPKNIKELVKKGVTTSSKTLGDAENYYSNVIKKYGKKVGAGARGYAKIVQAAEYGTRMGEFQLAKAAGFSYIGASFL